MAVVMADHIVQWEESTYYLWEAEVIQWRNSVCRRGCATTSGVLTEGEKFLTLSEEMGRSSLPKRSSFTISRNRNFSPKKLVFLERLVLMLWKYRQQCDLLRRYLIANPPDQNVGMWTRLWRSNCGRCYTLISNLDCRVCDTVGDHCNDEVHLLRLCCTLCSHLAIGD